MYMYKTEKEFLKIMLTFTMPDALFFLVLNYMLFILKMLEATHKIDTL